MKRTSPKPERSGQAAPKPGKSVSVWDVDPRTELGSILTEAGIPDTGQRPLLRRLEARGVFSADHLSEEEAAQLARLPLERLQHVIECTLCSDLIELSLSRRDVQKIFDGVARVAPHDPVCDGEIDSVGAEHRAAAAALAALRER